jgi:hypothetical protein
VPQTTPRRWPSSEIVAAGLVFVYLTFARTRNITETFVLLGDQILYWRMALGHWHDLPLVGPSSVGGTTLGPSFIWIVWLSRVLIGPFVENLPHAGGIGVALLQSAADALLLIAVCRATASLTLALSTVLLLATGPLDLALSATIWNPPVAVAFVKATIALVLLERGRSSIWWGLAATATAVLAVQAHSSAIFIAAPVIASFTARELLARRWHEAWRRARATIEVVAILEIPYLINLVVNRPERVAPSRVVEGLTASLAGHADLRLGESFQAVSSALASILLSPMTFRGFGVVAVVGLGLAAYRLRHELPLFATSVVPAALAVAGFATWQLSFDTYWFLTLAPPTTVALAFALSGPATRELVSGVLAPGESNRSRQATAWFGAALLVAVIAAQPARLAASMTSHRVPEYGALLRGTREIRGRTAEIRAIQTEFSLPPSADREFMYTILGGHITRDAPFTATIKSSGEVVFTPAQD